MLIKAFIDRFAFDGESVSMFYRSFLEEFSNSSAPLIKEKCTEYVFRLLRKLDNENLITFQDALETFLKATYFHD